MKMKQEGKFSLKHSGHKNNQSHRTLEEQLNRTSKDYILVKNMLGTEMASYKFQRQTKSCGMRLTIGEKC